MGGTPYCAFRSYRRLDRSKDRLVLIKQFCSNRILKSGKGKHTMFWNGAYCAAQEYINDIIDAERASA